MPKIIKKNLIVFFLAISIILSFSYLSYEEKSQRDLNEGKDWWALYFENPKNNSLNFVIENHGGSEDFHWEVYLEKNKTHENDILLNKGEKKSFQVSSDEIVNRKIIIKVTNGIETREIYKIL